MGLALRAGEADSAHNEPGLRAYRARLCTSEVVYAAFKVVYTNPQVMYAILALMTFPQLSDPRKRSAIQYI